jgi:hypothetical protein
MPGSNGNKKALEDYKTYVTSYQLWINKSEFYIYIVYIKWSLKIIWQKRITTIKP